MNIRTDVENAVNEMSIPKIKAALIDVETQIRQIRKLAEDKIKNGEPVSKNLLSQANLSDSLIWRIVEKRNVTL